MPKSRVRKKTAYTPPPTRSPRKMHSAPWLAPLMLVLFAVGITWLVVAYVTNDSLPGMSALGNWNLAVGFGFIVGGLVLATRWR